MKLRVSLILFYVLSLMVISANVNAQVPYVADIIEPVTNCDYPNGIAMYAGLPSSPYRTTLINGRLNQSSQYFNLIPLISGMPPGSFSIKSTCDPNTGDILVGVCGTPIGFSGYGGIVRINPFTALPNMMAYGNPVCINSDDGSFITYSFGATNVLSSYDPNGNNMIGYSLALGSNSAVVTITTWPGATNLLIVGPLPSGSAFSVTSCVTNQPCLLTATIPRTQDGNGNFITTIYQIVRVESSGTMRVLPLSIT